MFSVFNFQFSTFSFQLSVFNSQRMSSFFPNFRTLFNPDQFQGVGKSKRYFEGWYIKVVNADQTAAFAIIPGIAMDEEGHRQAFIQVLDGKRQTAIYHRFDFESFSYSEVEFSISIENNFFTADHIELDLPGMSGRLRCAGQKP